MDPSTRVVTGGRGPEVPGAPVNVAVPLTSTYRADGPVSYGREGNATWSALEEVVGDLEGGSALVFASGMAAIAAVVETVPSGSGVVVAKGSYVGARRFLADLESRGRIWLRTVDTADTASTLEACRGAKLLWVESPTNPMLEIADIRALAEGAHERGLEVAVDNTVATPLLQRPLDLGADVVVHSVTKFLSGHSDAVMGATVTRQPGWVAALEERRSLHGAVPGPVEAFLALRGVRTLWLRLERSQASAGELAARLDAHSDVSRVWYPGLAGHPGHDVAMRQMDGFGALLSFEVEGGAGRAEELCRSVRVCVPGTSLGGVETLIERRARVRGESDLPEGLVRISVGIEHVEDLWSDLEGALSASSSASGRR